MWKRDIPWVTSTVQFVGVDPATGKGLFTDLDEDGNSIGTTTEPSSEDRLFVGTPHPDYYGGFRNTLRWGGFDLMAFFQYSLGHEIYNGMRWYSRRRRILLRQQVRGRP